MEILEFGDKSKRKIILIHGFQCPYQVWDKYIEHYKNDFHIIVPIMPGHNPKLKEDFISFPDTAKELEDYLISRYGKNVYAVYGMSMGGVLTATLWQNNRLNIEKVIFDGSPLVSVNSLVKNIMLRFYLNVTHKSQQRDKKTLEQSKNICPEEHLEFFLQVLDNMSDTSITNSISSIASYKLPTNLATAHTGIFYFHGTAPNEMLAQKTAKYISKETLIKTKSPRSNAHTHAADFVTLRFNQRAPNKAIVLREYCRKGRCKIQNNIYSDWNPWHGCTKISSGCKYCYVYRQDKRYGSATASNICRKTQSFELPVKKNRDGSYKIPSGKVIFTCFTSDFLLKDADGWRQECWKMIKQRSDCWFYFFTKRIDRLEECLPPDWGDGYDNVLIGCTVENQDRADFRLPIFLSLPIKHRSIIAAPLLEKIDIASYLSGSIEQVSVSGESGIQARPCNYDWILDIRRQCVEKNVPFSFHQTGAHFIKDGKLYNIERKYQISQARKAGIDFRIGENFVPETAEFRTDEMDDLQLKL